MSKIRSSRERERKQCKNLCKWRRISSLSISKAYWKLLLTKRFTETSLKETNISPITIQPSKHNLYHIALKDIHNTDNYLKLNYTAKQQIISTSDDQTRQHTKQKLAVIKDEVFNRRSKLLTGRWTESVSWSEGSSVSSCNMLACLKESAKKYGFTFSLEFTWKRRLMPCIRLICY